KTGGMTDMLVSNAQLGKALAEALGKAAVVLMRGHGMAVVGSSLPLAGVRAMYTEVNARLQAQAIEIGGAAPPPHPRGIGEGRQDRRSDAPARLGSLEARGDGEIRQIAAAREPFRAGRVQIAPHACDEERAMRLFLGILLGIFITIAGAYVYDSMTTG